ncbi:hypothetical protein L7F22_001468 [Adiantum nelumboides]|nr:hypothetical protein [Adiantum nelumboides]
MRPMQLLILVLSTYVIAVSLFDMDELAAEATTVRVHNQCGNTVCAKYWVPNSSIGGGCSAQRSGGTWTVGVDGGWSDALIWAITNTGCGGQACNTGPPGGVTLFEFVIAGSGGNDYYDVSTLSGYNIAMRVVPTNSGCPVIHCRGTDAATCSTGYYEGGPDATKACGTGSTDYDFLKMRPMQLLFLVLSTYVIAASLFDLNELLAAEATTVRVHNQCGNTVCAKYWVPNSSIGGGCSEQGSGGTWTVGVDGGWSAAVIWAITNTGCGGQACNTGPPGGVTLFEFVIAGSGGNDYYDVSTLSGYNIAMRVEPTNSGCPVIDCRGSDAATCPTGYYEGGPDATKACGTGSTDYDVYLCPS